jgi:mRNA interferase MazF
MNQQDYPEIKRGDIYFADLGAALGSEQGGVRPVLVIQNNVGNRYSPTLIVAAVTSQIKTVLPTHVAVCGGGLRRSSTALLEQLRTIDRVRLREFMGTLGQREMKEMDEALSVSVGLAPGYR